MMAINERLFQALMQKNPDLSFGLQESFPFQSTYPNAVPLGPLMELGAQDSSFTAERAAQSLEYWRTTAENVLSDTGNADSPAALKSYSHDSVAAANLLAAHDFNAEAEQAYRIAARLWPGNPESVSGLADILTRTGRADEAQQIVSEFTQKYPDERDAIARLRANWSVTVPAR